MTATRSIKISAAPGELNEGLFGQVVLWTFEILPWLRDNGFLLPKWEICSSWYGVPPNYLVLPGAFDAADQDKGGPTQEIGLLQLRRTACSILGGDFHYAKELWTSYFTVPTRIIERAKSVGLPLTTLGLHYRGTDKNSSSWDTNPVLVDDFVTLTRDFLTRHAVEGIFLATDESAVLPELKRHCGHLPIFHVGAGEFHKQPAHSLGKADNAVLDCLLLSQCRYVLQCNSALSGFAKILSPDLEIYRVAASKLFGPFPYFPTAYIPRLSSPNPVCQKILERLMEEDWTFNANAVAEFGKPFGARPRGPLSDEFQ